MKDVCEALTLKGITEGVDIPQPPEGMSISDLRDKITNTDLNLEIEMEQSVLAWMNKTILKGCEDFKKVHSAWHMVHGAWCTVLCMDDAVMYRCITCHALTS